MPIMEEEPPPGQDEKAPPPYGSPEWARKILEEHGGKAFDPANAPPEVQPILTLREIPVATAGNLVLLSGQAGAAKSHSLAAMIASALAPEGSEPDCLGWQMPNPAGRALFYLDFEQSAQDFDALMRGAMRRARVDTLPPWFTALHLTGTEPGDGRTILHALLVDAQERHGGTLAVLLDGIADLAVSPNDETEAFALVRQVHAWADAHACAAVSVLHLNAGSDSPKMRGHLGSQAERKAETVLTAKRAEDVFTVYATKTRHRPIPERDGARFAWCEEAGMFVTRATLAEERADAKAEQRAALARDVFAVRDGMSHGEAVERIMELEALKERAAKLRLKHLREGGFVHVQRGTGLYHLRGKNHA